MVVVVAAVDCYKTSENTTATTTATTTAAAASTSISTATRFELPAALSDANANGKEAAAANNKNKNNNNHQSDNHKTNRSSNNMSELANDATTASVTTTTITTTNDNNAAAVAAGAGAATEAATAAAAPAAAVPTKSAVSQRNVDIKIDKTSNMEAATQQLTKKVLKLDLGGGGKNLDEYSLKSPKSPIAARLPHQTSLTSSVDVEDRKTLREALYQGIFHRHRRTIFAVGSFLRMLRSRNSQYNTIRSSSEGEDIDEVR